MKIVVCEKAKGDDAVVVLKHGNTGVLLGLDSGNSRLRVALTKAQARVIATALQEETKA